VGFADGDDLLEVMLAVDQLESAPLIDAEWAENHVAGAASGGSEELFGFGAEGIDAGKVFCESLSEFFSGERMGCGCGCDQRRGLAAGWKVAEVDERVLAEALQESGFGLGGSALDQAGIEGHLGAGVAEEQVFDDLLDAPLVGA
jgi:hypothetical protein